MLRLQSRVEGPPNLIALSINKLTIGRLSCTAAQPRLCLQHPDCPSLLSRQHATIGLRDDGKLIVRDLGSLNGTFASTRSGVPAVRIPANVDWPLCPGSLLYFGAKETVVSKDGIIRDNPFVYRYEGPAEVLQQTKAPTEQALSAIAQQEQSNQLHKAQPDTDLRFQPLVSQQPQQHHQQAQQQAHLDVEAPAVKRRKLLDEVVTISKGHQQRPAAATQQLDAAATLQLDPPRVTADSYDVLVHRPAEPCVAYNAAPAQPAQQLHQIDKQQQETALHGSEPEVLQPMMQQQQQHYSLPDHIPQQQMQQDDQQQQSPVASQHQQAVHTDQHPAGDDSQRRPLTEINPNCPPPQQTPAGVKKPSAAAASEAATVGAGPPALSPGMRVSSSTLECAVCKDIMVAPHSLNCGHTFCGPCLSQWLERPKPTCPTCRAAVTYAPILQRLIDSIISEAAINQDSEGQERAARLQAWEAVKDVTVEHWKQRFSGDDSSSRAQSKPTGGTGRQQGRTGAAAGRGGARARGTAQQQQHQQQHVAPAGVVALLPTAQRRVAGGPAAAAAARQAAQQQAATRTQATNAVAGAAAVPTAVAAGMRPRNQRSSARRTRGRGRGAAAAAAASRGTNPAGVASAVIQAQRQVESIARRLQARQRQPHERQAPHPAARPSAGRQVAIDSFLGHVSRAVQQQ